jgi:ribosomal protein L11 methyltransferase
VRRISVWLAHGKARCARTKLRAALQAARLRGVIDGARLEEEVVDDEAWAHAWKRFYQPFEIVRGLFIVPSWNESFRAPRDAGVLRLDPGMAFGTGQHPSTRLAIELAQRHLQANNTMLDIGCGSGIVGLVAALRGMRVYASDSDSIAVNAARKNFAHNHLRAEEIVKARDVPARFPQAELVIANITARVLERLATQLDAKLKPAGILITSGVVEAGKDRLLQALEDAELEHVASARSAEWLAFAHVKPGRPMRRTRPR